MEKEEEEVEEGRRNGEANAVKGMTRKEKERRD